MTPALALGKRLRRPTGTGTGTTLGAVCLLVPSCRYRRQKAKEQRKNGLKGHHSLRRAGLSTAYSPWLRGFRSCPRPGVWGLQTLWLHGYRHGYMTELPEGTTSGLFGSSTVDHRALASLNAT